MKNNNEDALLPEVCDEKGVEKTLMKALTSKSVTLDMHGIDATSLPDSAFNDTSHVDTGEPPRDSWFCDGYL
ncbi:MAG: hypothetical protein KGJ35_01680 [Patescibacteria group bacterium]|nr:hypothetical protein [Patescibacteria group bacterium]